MSNKFYLRSQNGTVVLAIKVQDAPIRQSPIYGESDVIIECSKRDRFNGFINIKQNKFHFLDVSYISWHGFYSHKQNRINNPVVKFHSKSGAQEYRHKGVVNKSDQFAFPIATFYLDSEKVNGFLYNSKRNYQQLLFNRSVVDIFLLPKGWTFHEYLKTSISLFYLIADMSIYNLTENCEFNPIEIGDMLFYHKMIAGRVILLRERELPEDIVTNGVSSVFHDPNAPLESLLNRYIAYGDESLSLFRDRYDEERI